MILFVKKNPMIQKIFNYKQSIKIIFHPRCFILNNMQYFFICLAATYSLEKALEFGMLPLVWDNTSPQSVLIAYTALYLKEEIQAEGLVRNLEDFARFLEVISFSHGGLPKIREKPRTSARGWIAQEP